jgi:phenylalanyl-tRNA synthetase alpha chain
VRADARRARAGGEPFMTDSDIARLRVEFQRELSSLESQPDLQTLRDKYLGRKSGLVTGLMKSVATAPPDQRPVLGRLANELKQEIEQRLSERRAALEATKAPSGGVDITLAGRKPPIGHRHPLVSVREEIEAIFTRMGYQVLEGPEVEDDYHNFEALNMAADHPARDMQDTLYLEGTVPGHPAPGRGGHAGPDRPATLLRTHTSPMQIRYMESHDPPVRIIVPGKVYRRDDLDLTHTPMFQQVEGLVVGERVTMADLKGTLTTFLHELFENRTQVLFRPSFFPYTEPSAEVFIGCVFCNGSGCPICKKTGWLEILGSGMVHPAVFEAVGYDSERYTGFAFGIGIERVAILKYGVDDIRLFYENDLRFLEQFPL